jgi:hypothetical protein
MTNARDFTARLADLLGREHVALAEFLVALAEFDRRRLWRDLGYSGVFMFLHRELGLSKGASHYRKVAADLVQRVPEIVAPLRDGRLCITSVVELAKVLTPENRDDVLPRFFHRSKREAIEVTAQLRPDAAPPKRDVVTRLPVTRALEKTASAPPHSRTPIPAPRMKPSWKPVSTCSSPSTRSARASSRTRARGRPRPIRDRTTSPRR